MSWFGGGKPEKKPEYTPKLVVPDHLDEDLQIDLLV
jgi:hypothetical protein